MSRHGDSVLVRTIMHPCNFCDVADKAEQRGHDNGTHDVYQSNFVFTQEQWDNEFPRILNMVRDKVLDQFTDEQTDATGARVIREHQVLDAIVSVKGGNGGTTTLLCHHCQQPVGVGMHEHVDGTPLCKGDSDAV
jgi:hypothetical protein